MIQKKWFCFLLVGLFFDTLSATDAQNERKISVQEVSDGNGKKYFYVCFSNLWGRIPVGTIDPTARIKWVTMLDEKIFDSFSRSDQEFLLRYCPFPFSTEYKKDQKTKEYE